MAVSLRPPAVALPSAPLPDPTAAPPAAGGDAGAPPHRRVLARAAVRRHAWLVVGAGAGAAGVAAGVEHFLDPVYESSASVRVQPKETHLPGIYQQPVGTGDVVGNELDLLRSRTLAERVVDSLGLRVRVMAPRPERAGLLTVVRGDERPDSGVFTFERAAGGFAVTAGKPARRLATATAGEPITLAGMTVVLGPEAASAGRVVVRVDGFQTAVTALGEAMTVERAGRESQVVAVRYRNADPALARDVPNAAVAHYFALRRRGQQLEATSTADALRQQVRTVSAELARSDSTLRRFRQRERVVNPQQEGTTGIGRVAQLRAERLQVGTERDAFGALMRALGERPRDSTGAELPFRQVVGFPSLMRNDAVWSYVRALTAVEEQRAALLVRRTPEDSDVIALTERARSIEQQLRGTATTYLDGLNRQTAALDAELGRAQGELARLPGQEAEFNRLERGPKVLGDMLTALQTRLKEAEVAEAIADPTVQRLDLAVLPQKPLRPHPAQDVPLAACAGVLLGLAGAFARERLDRTVRTRDDVRQWAGLPVLGVVPRIPAAGGLVVTEAFARLHAALAVWRELHTLVVTSPLSAEGKTTTAIHLARAVARAGSRAILVDADLRRGSLHTRFGLPRAPGLTDVLSGSAALDDVIRLVDLGGGVALAVVTAGTATDPARRPITADRVRGLLAAAGARYEGVIVDAPPINVTADAAVLASAADGVLLVARAGQTPLAALGHAAQQLGQAHATPLGVVVNDVDPARDAAYAAEYRFYDDPYFRDAESGRRAAPNARRLAADA